MQDLIKKLTENAGINEEQAAKAIETVVGFIKEKLPPMMHAAVDSFVGSKAESDDDGIL